MAVFAQASTGLAQQVRRARDDERTRYQQELVQRAIAEQAAGQHERALELALQVEQFGINPSVLMFIAEEHQALYHPAESLAYAERCLRSTDATNFPMSDREAIRQRCRELQSAAAGAAGSVRVLAPSNCPTDARIFVQGTLLPREEWGNAHSVPAGDVEIEATAPGHQVWRERIVVPRGQSRDVHVQWVPVPVCTHGSCATTTTSMLESRSYVGPALLLGSGAGFLAAGVAVWGFVSAPRSDEYLQCIGGSVASCSDARARELSDDVGNARAVQYLLMGAGGGLLIGGAAWLLTTALRPTGRRSTQRAVTVQPQATTGGFMLQVGGVL
jgi:hypothetical protein